ncbi:O-antigen ligase family protein [Falsiporphyromonas endometrii]|uniref:O-antigen ligase family protein n=1 Tax=Falsiporphyromonas endometrii TaxID=1387297 RepID=A0ABV9KA12_9PORP
MSLSFSSDLKRRTLLSRGYLLTILFLLIAGLCMKWGFDYFNVFDYGNDWWNTYYNPLHRQVIRIIFLLFPLIWAVFFLKPALVGKTPLLRRFIPLVAGVSCYYWLYSPMCIFWGIALIGVLVVSDYCVRRHPLGRVSWIIVALFIYASAQFVGVLNGFWTGALASAQNRMMFFALPLFALLYKPSESEVRLFLMILFRLFMLFMAFAMVNYFFYTSLLHESVFSCLTLNKNYFTTLSIPYAGHDILFGFIGTTFHPTFSACFFLIIFLTNLWGRTSADEGATKEELVAYYLLLGGFIIITQSRYGMLAFGAMSLCLFAERLLPLFMRCNITLRRTPLVVATIALLPIVFFAFRQKLFFNDPARIQMIDHWCDLFPKRWLLGWGTGSESFLIGATHCHNGFLSMMFTHGVVGLFILLVLVLVWSYEAYRTKNAILTSTGLFVGFLMLVDAPLNVSYGVSMLSILLIFQAGAPRITSPLIK